MRNILLVLSEILWLTTLSCQNPTTKDLVISDWQKKYNEDRVFFGEEFTSHFPKKIDKYTITFTEGKMPEIGDIELMLIRRFKDSKEAIETENHFLNTSLANYQANDSCLLVVNRFVTRTNYYKITLTEKDLLITNKECYKGLLPVPNFWHNDLTTEDTGCKLPKDFRLYVIDSKSGKYFDEKYLSNGVSMPVEWKNGYARGVAISRERNIIIYWLVIW